MFCIKASRFNKNGFPIPGLLCFTQNYQHTQWGFKQESFRTVFEILKFIGFLMKNFKNRMNGLLFEPQENILNQSAYSKLTYKLITAESTEKQNKNKCNGNSEPPRYSYSWTYHHDATSLFLSIYCLFFFIHHFHTCWDCLTLWLAFPHWADADFLLWTSF